MRELDGPDEELAWIPEDLVGPPEWGSSGADEDTSGAEAGGAIQGTPFAQGGAAGIMGVGPGLACLLDQARADDLARISDDELIGVMQGWHRLGAWAVAGELAAVAELSRRRDAEVAAGADPHLAEHADDEVAAALTMTGRAAGRLMDFAEAMDKLPLTSAALAAGEIDRAKALVIVDGVTGLEPAHALAVEAAVIGRAPGWTTGQLRAATLRAVLTVDPTAADRRRQEARREARVETWTEHAGTAGLAGRDLPPTDVLAADKRVDSLARDLKAAGAEASLNELRAAVFTALLLGRCPSALLSAPMTGSDQAGSSPDHQPTTGQPTTSHDFAPDPTAARPGPTDTSTTPGSTPTFPDTIPGTLGGSVNLTVPLATLLGTSQAPGEAAGFGPLTGADCRTLAAHLASQPDVRWCVTVTDITGEAAAHGCARAPSPAARDPGHPGSVAPMAGQPTVPGQWSLNLTITSLATGQDCAHERSSPGYRPPPSLVHIIGIRQRTCTFPGCRRPAHRCDQDHTIPYDQGGRTCTCNLAPLCRRHHRAKQAHGWHLDQPQPGVMVWTLPSGRQYTVRPTSYPSEQGIP
jgi:hypothetical protein